MADAALQHNAAAGHGVAGEYEAPLFGAYSKKVGMWLFLASDSLTFGALLFAFSYNRIYTVWPTPFGKESIINATVMTACLLSSSLTMVMAVFAAQRQDRSWTRQLAAGDDGFRHGVHRAARDGVDTLDPRRIDVCRDFRSPRGREPASTRRFRRACRSLRRHFLR